MFTKIGRANPCMT